jgi:regulator of protease activity HflC (stomatin/prohibitin superfamily)
VSQTYEKWGIHVERIELQDLRPKATSGTANAMKKQMIAERSRRSEFIMAEGNKAAMRLKSEGVKIVKANLGVAEQEATRKRSEGDATAKVSAPCPLAARTAAWPEAAPPPPCPLPRRWRWRARRRWRWRPLRRRSRRTSAARPTT